MRGIRLKKAIKILIVVILLGGVLFHWFRDNEEQKEIIIDVIKGNIQKNILASGILQAVDQVNIGAQVSGQIQDILVSEGQYVKKGELLAIIDPQLAQSELKLAKAELESSQANMLAKQAILKQYQTNFERHRKLIKQNASSQQEFDEARTRLEVAKADIRIAQSNLESANLRVTRAKTQLAYTEIRSPVDGTVVSIIAQSGQTLAAQQQVPTLMTLANIDTMKISAKISEADIMHVQAGAPVAFTLLGEPDKEYYAVLDSIKLVPTHIKSVETGTSNNHAIYYYATFKVPNPEHKFKISMTAAITITLDRRENVITLPFSALGKKVTSNQYQVMRLNEDGNVDTIIVTTGLRDNSHVEVVSGLSLKDKIILPISSSLNSH
ncbi:hemolysin D [[Haemophilus] ducreyi]|uniref:efflux RND transporter periplasmic adaptor subunit n=1 Tax=Haemophilus ducreyi TaxID=730 RepID=UPI0006558333|nr:hemolysin D [[Haemophilus] ducreyi]